MKKYFKNSFPIWIVILLLQAFFAEHANAQAPVDSIKLAKSYTDDPAAVKEEVTYDPETKKYKKVKKIGDLVVGTQIMTFDEYWNERYQQAEKKYFDEKVKQANFDQEKPLLPPLKLPGSGLLGDIFTNDGGTPKVEIKPTGSAELIFGLNSSTTKNPAIPVRNQTNTNFQFNQKIQLNIVGTIGDKLKLTTNYNTESTFDFENQMKLEYTGSEDEIIKKIEVGNVSLPLQTQLIQGGQTLFGVKSELQFGKLTVTSVITQQKGESKTTQTAGGVQIKDFKIQADNYEANRHFFLSQYFADNYDAALAKLPYVNSSVQITRVEVWMTNVGNNNNEDSRKIVGFMDLGEHNTYDPLLSVVPGDKYPYSNINNLYSTVGANPDIRNFTNASTALVAMGYVEGAHFNKIENARKLKPDEFTFHPQLGYISLNTELNADQILAVAFQYTVTGISGVFQVGEFSNDGSNNTQALYVKLLKTNTVNNTHLPTWELMMKNVYYLGESGIKGETFQMQILYTDPTSNQDINFVDLGGGNNKRWVQLMNADTMNIQQDSIPDGFYDYVEGVTIKANSGRIFFPVRKPFGEFLRKQLGPTLANKYCFDSLYTVTPINAKLKFPAKDRFKFWVKFESSQSSVISLGSINVPVGSVVVTAGGKKLLENVDYTVNYSGGQVTIINEGILNSGTPISVSSEANALISIQTKNLIGSHLEYKFSNNFNVGGTIMNLTERPLTFKVDIGQEPMSNTIWGLNTKYRTDLPIVTKLLDKLPLLSTKEMSTLDFTGEVAQLLPGTSNAIQNENSGKGESFIDNFDGAESNTPLTVRTTWFIASTPHGLDDIFPEGKLSNQLANGFNRAKLSWYNIDPLFSDNTGLTPNYLKNDAAQQNNNFVRPINQSEVFPQKSAQNGITPNLITLDLAYYPNERGQYNFDTTGGAYSAGVDKDGHLLNPKSRWGGMMRRIETPDFEASNIEFLEFWMMDPFYDNDGKQLDNQIFNGTQTGGDLYIHIGNLSEDVLRDSRKSFENGLPVNDNDLSAVDTTIWGLVPTGLNLVNAFNTDPASRPFQDVGYDGLSDQREQTFYSKYLEFYNKNFGAIPSAIANDPSADDFRHYRDDNFNLAQAKVIERYKDFSSVDGNSPASTNSAFLASATTIPDIEDLNKDNTLNEGESYYEYHISMRPNDLDIEDQKEGRNYINNIINPSSIPTINGYSGSVSSRWIHFRIPIRKPERAVGSIQDFRSMRYVRIMLKGWEDPVILRFGRMDLVRETWRKYESQLKGDCEFVATDNNAHFVVTSINVEEDSQKQPIPYVPPVQRVYNVQTQSTMNEQALYLNIEDLDGCDSRAAFKNTSIDMRAYNCLKMFVHAEKIGDASGDYNNKMSVFLRMGSDFDDNYYEYEIPLKFTESGTFSVTNTEEAIAAIWPSENAFDFDLSVLTDAKLLRNSSIESDPATFFKNQRYRVLHEKNSVYVKGNPTMSAIKVILIGVRNNGDPGQKRSVGVWANELRLSCFNDQSGWAATATATMKVADFANLSVTGKMYTPGWGAITDKVADRKKEYYQMYDALASLELGKLIPSKYNVSVPLYLGFSETFQNQQFSPLDQDVDMKRLDPTLRKKVQDSTQTYQRRKSLNLSNVRKNRTVGSTAKPMPYDIENFDATYVFNETFKSDVNTRYNVLQTYKGALNYNFTHQPKNFQPFIQSPIVGFYKKVVLNNYQDKEAIMQEEIDRLKKEQTPPAKLPKLEKDLKELKEKKESFTKLAQNLMKTPYNKLGREFNFYIVPSRVSIRSDWNRLYNESVVRNNSDAILLITPVYNKNFFWDRNYDVSWDFTKALKFKYTAMNRARIDEPEGRIDTKEKKAALLNGLIGKDHELGRTTNFSQNMDFNYELPLKKIPFTDWITANAKYTAKMDWQAAPLAFQDVNNSISNNNTKQLTANFNFVNLYNKSPYLKKINNNINKQKKAESDTTKKKSAIEPINILETSLRLMMMVRNASFTYSENNGTFLPGYVPKTKLVGMDFEQNSPGAGFIFGSQEDILTRSAQNGWLTANSDKLNTRYSKSHTENLNLRATLEPINKMRIELTATRTYGKDSSFVYRLDQDNKFTNFPSATTTSYTFSITTISLGSAFEFPNKENSSAVYDEFVNSRAVIAARLAAENHNSNPANLTGGFPEGYGKTQTDVIVQSFITAYTGGNATVSILRTMPKIPMPNWKINYDGFMKMPFFSKYFQSFTCSHSYTSTLNQGFSKNLPFEDDGSGYTTKKDSSGNFIPKFYYASGIVMSEQLSPLIKFDATLKSSWIAKFEMSKTRTVSLNLIGLAVSEISTFKLTAGTGYKIKDVKLPFKILGKNIKSNLDIRADLSLNQSKSVLRKEGEKPQVQNGTNIISLKTSADYVLSAKLNLSLKYEIIFNTPANSLSFPTSNSMGSVNLRYTL
ncbi:MAG: cell surface protein SprA [Bacteroidetes bacterium]|nr:cell surface protein SprA [Bacteroidota bacterium]